MGFKQTLIKSITAVLCVIAICIAANVSTNKIYDAKTAGADTSTQEDGAIGDDTASGDVTDVAGGDVDVTNAEGETVTNASGDVITEPASDASNADTSTGSTTKSASGNSTSTDGMPKNTAEIIDYYNTATGKVVSSKAGYAKTRTTDGEKLEGSAGLKAMKSLVYKFMGIGAENAYTENVEKGKWGENPYIIKGDLSTADVTKATCTQANGNFTITLSLKNGSSSASKSNPTTKPTAALDKCGICVGTEDKSRFDHKTASVIYDAIEGTYAGAEVAESYSNATVVAVINKTSGNLVSLKVEWNQSATLSKLLGMSATASGKSHVTYSSFKF